MKPLPPPQGEPQTNFAIGQAAARPAEHRTNADGTCLWCGEKLARIRWTMYGAAAASGLTPERLAGAYGDGRFCNMRCGYAFGVWAAHLGFRLAPRE